MYLEPTIFLLTSLEVLLNIILKQYFQNNCITIITESPLNLAAPKSSVIFSPSIYLTSQLLNSSEMGCLDYIINLQNPGEFMNAFEEVTHLSTVRKSDRKLIFLCEDQYYSCKGKFLEVLNSKIAEFLPNIILIYPSEKNVKVFNIETHEYVGNTEMSHKPMLLDEWDSNRKEFIVKKDLFPRNISNLFGKTVKVACFTYKPYVLLDLEESLSPMRRDGMEMRIIEEFCMWVNCTIEIVRDDEHEWGEIFENRTGVGVIGNVLEDRADFGIGISVLLSVMQPALELVRKHTALETALYSWYEEYIELDFSASCIKTSITCIAPAPRLLSNWRTPFLPFSLYMWGAIMTTFLLSSVALTVAQGFSVDKIFLTTFGMLITQSRPDIESSWRIRSVTIWLLITGLVIDNAYSGGLASTFTVPEYERSIDTIKDIIDRKLEWGATHDAWIFSIISSEDEVVKKLLSLFRTYQFEELKRKSFDRSMAYSIEKLPAGHFAIGEYVTEEAVGEMMIMLEDFYYEYSVVMMRKSSPYTEKLSQLILRLHESGLILAWEKQVALKYLNYNIQLGVRLSRSKRDADVEPLNLQQFMGIYLIYGCGVMSSIVIFIMEVLYGKKKIGLKRFSPRPHTL